MDQLYEHQGQIDTLKVNIKDLLKKKPDAPGAEILDDTLNEIISRWKDLQEKCKKHALLEPDVGAITTEFMELEYHLYNLSMLVILMLKISAEGKSINKILMIHFKLTNNLLMQVKLNPG